MWPVSEPPASSVSDAADRPDVGRAAAWRHVRACHACRRWLRRDAEVSLATSRAEVSRPAPESLRRRIERAIDAETAAERRSAPRSPVRGEAVAPPLPRWPVAAALAGVLTLAAVAGEPGREGGPGPEGFSGTLARDFVRHAREEVRLSVADPEAISRFFGEHVGRTVEPVRVPGAEIRGAMICWLEERPTAMVMYRIGGHAVAHYRARLRASGGSEGVRSLERAGVHLAEWTRNGDLHALVSDLDREKLVRLAQGRFGGPGGRDRDHGGG